MQQLFNLSLGIVVIEVTYHTCISYLQYLAKSQISANKFKISPTQLQNKFNKFKISSLPGVLQVLGLCDGFEFGIKNPKPSMHQFRRMPLLLGHCSFECHIPWGFRGPHPPRWFYQTWLGHLTCTVADNGGCAGPHHVLWQCCHGCVLGDLVCPTLVCQFGCNHHPRFDCPIVCGRAASPTHALQSYSNTDSLSAVEPQH